MVGDPTVAQLLRAINTLRDIWPDLGIDEAMDRAAVPDQLRDDVRALHERQAGETITRVRGVTQGGPKAWWDRDQWDPANGYYWPRQRSYLLDQIGRSPAAVDATDDDSSRVLKHLEDPRDIGPDDFDVRGLVMGHVQSGKTENFSALIAKALDLGYRLVIVLSGVHNGLRLQTQRRLARELGIKDMNPGVGRPEAGMRVLSLTHDTLDGDFDGEAHDPSILQGNERVIIVCKKWHTVLAALNDYIDRADVPESLPVLIIDDEADQASINTGGNRADLESDGDDELEVQPADELVDANSDVDAEDEIDPSTTNRLIRELLIKFRRRSYVAYTATPFANVLIPHDAHDREVYDDLFPRDFILTLYPRPGYVGAERLFGRDSLDGDPEDARPGLDVIRFIDPAELPAVSPKQAEVRVADFEPSMSSGMEQAVHDWVLSTAAMVGRLGWQQPSTMLIHIHQQTRIQNELAPQVQQVIDDLRRAWRYEKQGPVPDQLRERWDADYRPVTRRIKPELEVEFAAIAEHIDRLLRDPVPVLALNSASDDELDFTRTPDLKAILVGGNRLSRGMTLEGLTVSYYVRETPYMDTLLQMGRWFGYREDYVDLTRLWTTRLLAGWFRDIALREEELRQIVLEAERERLKPIDAGVRIRSHPAMMVTSQAKSGAGRKIRISYSGTLIQTSRFRLWEPSGDWLHHNLGSTQRFLAELGEHRVDHQTDLPIWSEVPAERVVAFLREYQTVQTRRTFDSATAAQYIEAQNAHDELLAWTVAVRTPQRAGDGLEPFPLGAATLPEVNAISRTRLKHDHTSIGVLTQPAVRDTPMRGDEEIGLSLEQAQRAREELEAEQYDSLREALIAQRGVNDGLLIIYPISRFSKPRPGSDDRIVLFDDPTSSAAVDVVGMAIVFPRSSSHATVEYIAQYDGEDGEPE